MSDYDGVLQEDMNHKLDALLEGQASLAHLPGAVSKLQEDMTEVKADIKTVKLAVKDQSKDHKALVKRVAERWNQRSNDNDG